MMNIAIYARYSSEAQRPESIEQQIAECKKYAIEHKMNIVATYKDEAKTGRNDDRKDFQKMIRDSKHRTFEAVLVWKFDRFARNMRDALNYEYELEQNGVKVISAKELIPEGAIGIVCKAVMLGNNEFYSADLAEKTVRGMTDNAEKCLYNGGVVPLGFKITKGVKVGKQWKDRTYAIDEANSKWVEKIFTLYANGKSVKEICEYLNSMGIKSAKGAVFNKNSLHTMFKNEKYIGTYTYRDVNIPNGIPRIISDELFETVQKMLAANKEMPSRKRAIEEYLLTGKLFCGHCKDNGRGDVMLIGHSGNASMKYCYYKCKNGSKSTKTCDKKLVPKEYIEEFVIQKCRSLLTDKNIAAIAKGLYAVAQKDNANLTLANLMQQQKEKQRAKDNVVNALEKCEDDTVRQELFVRIKQLIAELEGMEKEIAVERTKTLGIEEKEIRFFLTQFRDYDILNVVHRRAIIDLLVNKIYLYDDKAMLTLQSGVGEVEITAELYADISENTMARADFLPLSSGHHFYSAHPEA